MNILQPTKKDLRTVPEDALSESNLC